MPVDRMGKGNQDGGLAARRDLGDRRRARPAHDQIRLAKRPRDVKDKRGNLSLESSVPVSHSDFFVIRSEEHTSELQSRLHLVCRLLLEKKKTTDQKAHHLSSSI